MTTYRRSDPIPIAARSVDWQDAVQPVRDQTTDLNKLAARRIFEAIISNGLVGEGLLPNEEELGRELAVSRTVVREAVKSLASKSIVQTRRKRGTKVLPIEEWNLLDSDVISWMSESGAFPQIGADLANSLSLTLPELAVLAAKKAARSGEFSALATQIADADPDERIQLMLDFHVQMSVVANNPFLACLVRNTVNGLRLHNPQALKKVASGWMANDFVKIAAAIDEGAPERACELISQLFVRTSAPVA